MRSFRIKSHFLILKFIIKLLNKLISIKVYWVSLSVWELLLPMYEWLPSLFAVLSDVVWSSDSGVYTTSFPQGAFDSTAARGLLPTGFFRWVVVNDAMLFGGIWSLLLFHFLGLCMVWFQMLAGDVGFRWVERGVQHRRRLVSGDVDFYF